MFQRLVPFSLRLTMTGQGFFNAEVLPAQKIHLSLELWPTHGEGCSGGRSLGGQVCWFFLSLPQLTSQSPERRRLASPAACKAACSSGGCLTTQHQGRDCEALLASARHRLGLCHWWRPAQKSSLCTPRSLAEEEAPCSSFPDQALYLVAGPRCHPSNFWAI